MEQQNKLKSLNNCWDLFNELGQDGKSKIIALGLSTVIQHNFTTDETKDFLKTIFGLRVCE